ncbi:MAG: hypothetical protein Q8O03_08020 [Nanoarchaeota archaeon]|nr:hypothetical protein [Nanoarchaeota archaeon]
MNLIIIGLSIIAALITWELNVKYCLGGVRASSLVSLIAGLIVYFLKLEPIYGVAVMGASFAAMSTEYVIPKRFWMLVCGFIYSIVFINLPSNLFTGFGGKLGTTACMSVVMTLGVIRLFGGCKRYSKLLQCKIKNKKKKF